MAHGGAPSDPVRPGAVLRRRAAQGCAFLWRCEAFAAAAVCHLAAREYCDGLSGQRSPPSLPLAPDELGTQLGVVVAADVAPIVTATAAGGARAAADSAAGVGVGGGAEDEAAGSAPAPPSAPSAASAAAPAAAASSAVAEEAAAAGPAAGAALGGGAADGRPPVMGLHPTALTSPALSSTRRPGAGRQEAPWMARAHLCLGRGLWGGGVS